MTLNSSGLNCRCPFLPIAFVVFSGMGLTCAAVDSPVGGDLNRFIEGFYIKHLVDVYCPDVFMGLMPRLQ